MRNFPLQLLGKQSAFLGIQGLQKTSEVGIRKTYKEKLFQHPIHQEFMKSYNKLYGRIRRGKIP